MYDLFLRIPQKKREKIIETAIAEFAGRGYNEANINTIAGKAGVSIGILYKYFENKEDLYLYIVDYGTEMLAAELGAAVDKDADLFENIEKVLRTIQRHSRENSDIIKLYMGLCNQNHSEFAYVAAKKMESLTSKLYAELIAENQGSGKIPAEFDPKMLAFFLDNLFMMLQFSYACDYYAERMRIYAGNDIFDRDDELIEQFMLFIKNTFKA